MTDNIRYLNEENSSVLVNPQGFIAPQPCLTHHQDIITQWEEGRTDEWDLQKSEYDNYVLVMSYESDLEKYNSDVVSCIESVECISVLVIPTKPVGYYTQEEVDASQLGHDTWQLNKTEWENDPLNNGFEYPVIEPEILLRPENLPVILEPDNLVPNIIDPYYEYYEWTDEQALSNKEQEINSYGSNLITEAYSNPVQNSTVDPVFYKLKVDRRKSNKSDKLSGEISLTQEEKDESKTDEKLSEYEVKISDDQDKVILNVNKLSGVDNIMAFDVIRKLERLDSTSIDVQK